MDLKNIFNYYLEESLETFVPVKIIEKLEKAIFGLNSMPRSHPIARESLLREKQYRKLICDDFIITFKINEETKTVSVIRVFHGKMNYQRYL